MSQRVFEKLNKLILS